MTLITPLDGLTQTICQIPSNKHVIIVSHSNTRLVQDAGLRLKLPLVLLDRDTYGIDRVGYRRKDYHSVDHTHTDHVYDHLCGIFGVSADQALLVEDSERNLAFAKQCGWQTMHIHWQKTDQEAYLDGKPSYIDYTSGNTVTGLRDLQHKKPCIK